LVHILNNFFPALLKPIMTHFPNLSKDTIEKLSTPEGIENRHIILQTVPIEELTVKPLQPEIDEINNLIDLKNLSENQAMSLCGKTVRIKTDELIDILSGDDNREIKNELIRFNIEDKLLDRVLINPNLTKQEVVYQFISENPRNKDVILEFVREDIDNQFETFKSGLGFENFQKVKERLIQQDLKEIQSLGENKTIDQIKTLKSVNKSHSDLLASIKNQQRSGLNSTQFQDEMNLFDIIDFITNVYLYFF
jgi:hypothetical protein